MDTQFAQQLIQKTAKDYNVIAEHFSSTRQEGWPEFESLISLMTRVHENDLSLLDVGCGNGRLSEVTTNMSITYTGIDISENLITEARNKYPQHKFTVSSMLELPFQNTSFDVITAIASLLHVPSHALRVQTVQELARVAKPGATLFMTNWNLYQPQYAHLFENVPEQYKDAFENGDVIVPWRNAEGELQAERYYHAFTEQELEDLLQNNGWHIEKQWYQARGKPADKITGFNIVTVAKCIQ